MPSDWEWLEFGSLYKEPSKNGLMAPSKVRGTGALLVNMREIFAYDQISNQDMERTPLPSRNPEAWLLRPGDLLFARQSLTLAGAGKVSLIVDVPEPMTFESHIIRVRLDEHRASSRFFYYLFRSPLGRDLMESIVEQVTAAGIRSSDLARLTLPVPPLDEQHLIAEVIASFDDLIDVNRSNVAALRRLAAATWSQGSTGGEIVPFGEIAHLAKDGVSGSSLATGTPYIGLEHFATDGNGLVGVGDAGNVGSNKLRFAAGDVLYGKLRPYFRKHDRPGFSGVCSTEIWVLRPLGEWGSASVDAIVSLPEFTEFAIAGSGGTRMPRADWSHVATMPVMVPRTAARRGLEATLDDLWRSVVALQSEITELSRVRDQLLPLLISGNVRVTDSLEVAG